MERHEIIKKINELRHKDEGLVELMEKNFGGLENLDGQRLVDLLSHLLRPNLFVKKEQ
jgi:hypothetical protein